MRQLLILSFIIILFSNCNNSNKSWSAADRDKGMKACMDETEAKLGEKDAKKLCNCVLTKAMSKYSTYQAADDGLSEEEATKMTKACAKDIGIKTEGGGGGEEIMEEGGGKKKGGGLFGGGEEEEGGEGKKITGEEEGGGGAGNGWTKTDRSTFFNQCKTGLVEKGYTAARATKLCNCFLEKIESRYSSMKEADERGGEAAGAKAMRECLNEESGGGNEDDEN